MQGNGQSLEDLLKSIIEKGYYSFKINHETCTCELSLCVDASDETRRLYWSEEEVSDFVRRLGFLDISKGFTEQFLYVNEVGIGFRIFNFVPFVH